MESIFVAEAIRALDRYTIEHEGVTSVELVERAAATFVSTFKRLYAPSHRIYVFAGPGKNGADALAIARLLLDSQYVVDTILFNISGHLSDECAELKDALLEADRSRLYEVNDTFEPPIITDDAVIIDGLFGTGLNRPLTGGFASLVGWINSCSCPIVSVDIPSGLFAEDNSGNDTEAIIRATHTFTFESPKLAFLFADNAHFVGACTTLPIGLSSEGKESIKTSFFFAHDEDAARSIIARPRFGHKGTFGHALLVAGSWGKMGAACLAAKAALRSGLGRLTAHIPASGYDIMQISVPEAMVSVDDRPDHSSCVVADAGFSAIGVGPGIGTKIETVMMLSDLIDAYRKPMVFDADALNILSENTELLDRIPAGSILTPHPLELDRICSRAKSDYDRLSQAQALAIKHDVYVVLKGAYTATCMPSGNVVFNSTGNSGMGTAGSGDVLTGLITGLLASGYPPASASVVGVYLHGMAGDIYAGKYAQQTLTASDIIDNLGLAFRQLRG